VFNTHKSDSLVQVDTQNSAHKSKRNKDILLYPAFKDNSASFDITIYTLINKIRSLNGQRRPVFFLLFHSQFKKRI